MDLSSFPAIDQHAHNLARPEIVESWPYTRSFSEAAADDQITRHAPQALAYRRSLRDVAALLGCATDEESIVRKRRELGLEELARRCFTAARLEAVLMDDGFMPETVLPIDWHRPFVTVHRVLRIEHLAEQLLADGDSFVDFVARFKASIDPPPTGVVAYKSIVCYRSGLSIHAFGPGPAEAAHRGMKSRGTRLLHKALLDYLVCLSLEASARNGLPVQFHTGFGDPDLDLRQANPLHLREILENARFKGAAIVLLHASYPFTRETGYLASVYPNVYLDTGLAVPLLSVAGMRRTMGELLELAPVSKVMYSSDAHFIPELFYLAGLWGRRLLAEVLDQAVRDGDLTGSEAEEAARAVLSENARRLYRLGVSESGRDGPAAVDRLPAP
jgi:predicted TIM-barrel fold metal-dependent hydrolase